MRAGRSRKAWSRQYKDRDVSMCGDQLRAAARAVVDGGAMAEQQQVDVERGHARDGVARHVLVPGQKTRSRSQAPAAADGVAREEHAARLHCNMAGSVSR